MPDKPYDSETGCCERFDPAPWDGKTLKFTNTLFVKDRVRSFFHIPINFGKVMKRDMERIAAAKALSNKPILLSDENSLWGADIYIAVSKKVDGFENVTVPGTFMSKVFEGPFKNTGKWVKEMQDYVQAKGKTMEKPYFFYTTCPKCAKHYGKNYVVLLAKI